VISRPRVESQYRALTDTTCELMWIRGFLSKLHLLPSTCIRLYYDNTMDIHITKNLFFHERTGHIEVDCHLLRQMVTKNKIIELQHVYSFNKLADMLTKPSKVPQI